MESTQWKSRLCNLRRLIAIDPVDFQQFKRQLIITNNFNEVLRQYFIRKQQENSLDSDKILSFESLRIHKVFPHVDLEFIVEQIDLFRDFDDRVEIVLRILSQKTTRTTGTKRIIDKADNDELPVKIQKIEDENAPLGELPSQNHPEVAQPPPTQEAICSVFEPLLHDQPSTSRATTSEEGKFDLIQHLNNKTNLPMNFLKWSCDKMRLNFNLRPRQDILDEIIENVRSLSKEDLSDSDDNDAVAIEEGALINSGTTNAVLDLTSTNELEEKTVSCSEKLKTQTAKVIDYLDVRLVSSLCELFPDACPDFIRELCRGKIMSETVQYELIQSIFEMNNEYPKRPVSQPEPEVMPQDQFEILLEFLPDIDPDYLRVMCDNFNGNTEQVKLFLNNAMEKRNYPKLKDYQRRQQLSAQQKQYTTEFDVENFIKLIPDPKTFFANKSRMVKATDHLSSHYAVSFLRNKFDRLPLRVIQAEFGKYGGHLFTTYNALKRLLGNSDMLMKTRRKPIVLTENLQNIPLLQEIAYLSHEEEIEAFLYNQKLREIVDINAAKANGLMRTCNCCYDENVLPKNTFTCPNGCEFCRLCLVRSTEILFGEGKLDFPCLSSCSAIFTLQTLQSVLPPKIFSKIAQKKAVEEVKSAGIEELEMCPFCDFATIPAEGDKIFHCLNPECMKESCRECKEPSHIPYRCDEIEKDDDVKARVFVENQMTEALLRKCHKCNKKFFKEEGCNKMTCICGAQMCYVCGEPVTDYKHFNGNGGTNFELCPLYSDSHVLNKKNVLEAAKLAKAKIDNKNLKSDPSIGIDEHYRERAEKIPVVGVVNNNNRGDIANDPMMLFFQDLARHH